MLIKKKKTPKDYRILYCRAEEHIDEINSLLNGVIELYPSTLPKTEYKKRRNDFIQEALLIGLKALYSQYAKEIFRDDFKRKKSKKR